ncbi:MAG: tetratricopeptide repeat protein [Verrucomicrobiota bacterium]
MTLSSLDPKLPASGAAKTGSRFVLELFVILCLSVCYYFLVRNFTLGVGYNHTNGWVFTACSQSNYHLDGLYDVWKGRLSGMLLSGALFDLLVKGDGYQIGQYAMLFGLYQAFWLLVLMLTMLVAVRESLLVNLGIFAGLICNFAPAAGFYFYPWDLPATVFLTLAVLLHERGRWGLMLAAIGVGCFFKETVLVGVVLCLFNRGWKWHWRLLGFAGPLAFYFLGKRYLISSLHLNTAVLAMGDSTNVRQLLRADFLINNLKLLFSDQAAQVLFANAGTLVAVLVLGWARRFRPYLWMIVAYVAGQFMYGTFSEVRIFMQVLPLSCLVLSEYAQGWIRRSADAVVRPLSGSNPDQQGRSGKSRVKASKPIAGKSAPARVEGAWACRKSARGLILIAVVVMLITGSVVVLAYDALLRYLEPEKQMQVLAELRTKAERGEVAAQYVLGNDYYKGLGVATNWPEAFYWFREAAGRGHTGAQLALGWCYLQGEGTAQSFEASIPWFRKVAAQGRQEGRCYRGLAYDEGLNMDQGLAGHYQYLAWLGPLSLAAAGLITVAGVALRRKSLFEPALCVAMVLTAGALGWRWRYGGVESLWQRIILCDPNCYLAYKNLGYALFQTGQADKALTCLQKATELNPADASAQADIGNILAKNGRPDEALIHYQRSVELNPDNAGVQFNIGNMLVKKGRPDEAIAYYQKALELEPANASAHFYIGNVLLKNGRLNEAAAHFRKAIELRPDNAAAHNNLGFALAKKGQLDEAIRQYHEALRLKPDFAEASNNLVVLEKLDLQKAAAKPPSPSTKE